MNNHIIDIEDTVETGKQDKGFTLVELLIVIVILGILAAVTVFAVRGITDRGQDNACATDKRTMEVAVEAYFAKVGGSTVSESGLVTEGLLKAQSSLHDVSSAGVVSVQSGSDCA